MPTDTIVNAAVPLAVFVIMFALGVGLTIHDFRGALTRPKALLLGIIAQVCIVPITGIVYVSILHLDPEIALGIVILALCPGGAMSNVLTRIAGGDVALSVTLTGATNLLAVATLPVLTLLAVSYFRGTGTGETDIQEVTQRVLLVVTVPVLLGALLRHFVPNVMRRYQRAIFRFSLAVFLLIIAWAFIESFEALYNGLAVLGWQLTVLIVVLFSLGYGIGWMFTLSPSQRTTLALETGVQNSGLGLAAATMLSSEASGFPVSAIPSVVYSALVYLLVFPFTIWLSRRQNRPAVPPPMD